MRTFLVLFALTTSCFGDTLPFYGNPRPMFREFWAGARESQVNTPKFALRCRQFAAHHSPESTIPEMLRDFAQCPGETKGFVYAYIMSSWPRKTVMGILTPYMNSPDKNVGYIAANFYADFESPK